MKFKNLPVYAVFEFDRSDLAPHLANGMPAGPWVKLSARKYQPWQPFWWKVPGFHATPLKVGSVNVAVSHDVALSNEWKP